MDYIRTFQERLRASLDVKQRMLEDADLAASVAQAAQLLLECCRREEGTVFFAGNGGSSSDAQHLAGELIGRFYINRPGLAATALGVNPAVATALGNDFAYEDAFARELDALSRPDDVFVGLSTSGNSGNIVRCLTLCKAKGLHTIGLTGGDGGKMRDLCDVLLVVPSDDTPRIQESHILLGHVLCEIVEQEMFGKKNIGQDEQD